MITLAIGLLASFILIAVLIVVTRQNVQEDTPMSSGPHDELIRLLQEKPSNRRFYIATKRQPAGLWKEAKSLAAGQIILNEGDRVSIGEIRAFVVTYPSGEILVTSIPPPVKLPQGTFFAKPISEGYGDKLRDEDIQSASKEVKVEFGQPRSSKSRGTVYETRVINGMRQPIRITHFGAYSRKGNEWILNTIVEGFFTDQQFQEWYGVADDGWLAPGASAADPENYGPKALWIYFFETRDGQTGKAAGQAP